MKENKTSKTKVSEGILNSLKSFNQKREEIEKKNIEELEHLKNEEVQTNPEEEKFKRSYMLTKKEIKRVTLLKAYFEVNDYSEVIRRAINELYDRVEGENINEG